MKKLISLLVVVMVIKAMSRDVAAASDPKILFGLDCNTQEKMVVIGFQSNPDSPDNGPEIIAITLTTVITPSGTSTIDDVKNASLKLNPSYSNAIEAEASAQTIGSTVEAKITVGFKNETGLKHAKDLVLVKGIDRKVYQIALKSAKMYPKNATNDIFKGGTATFSADPTSCVTAQPAPVSTPAISTGPTTITFTKDKEKAKAGESVAITALIKNRNNASLDWVQKSGSALTPDIKNEEQADGTTKSVFTFVMPQSGGDMSLELKVGSVIEKTGIAFDKPVVEATPPATTGNSAGETLEERLARRRQALQNEVSASIVSTPEASTPESLHKAAGETNLTGSGPRETLLLSFFGTLLCMLLWKKIQY